MKRTKKMLRVLAIAPLAMAAAGAIARDDDHSNGAAECAQLAKAMGVANTPGALHGALENALKSAVATESSGLNFDMWGTLVNRDGVVCAVAFSGGNRGAQWPGSRVISAQKAYTANAFSLNGLALSTANLFSAVQPGGSLYGLQHSNPVDTGAAYKGPAKNFGQANDPMVGERVGGVNVFGGGLGLYAKGKVIVGAVGVSGDTSCADHNIGWRLRNNLGLDFVPGGVSGDATRPDNIVFDILANPNGGTGKSAGGFGHPECLNTDKPGTAALPVVKP
ncbi:MAG: heme-binding protein [Gammaproteobacteria bacterium]